MDLLTSKLTAWPTTVAATVRRRWSTGYFSADSAAPERSRARHLFILFALPAMLLYPCLSFRLLEPDEGRYAEIPREMLARGDWIVPYLQGVPYLDKPPLLYWLTMLSYSAFGVNDAAARLVPALAVHLTILTTYVFGCRLFGARRALCAALLLSIMPGLLSIGRLLTLDGLLTLWVTIGLLSGIEFLRTKRFGWLCAIACGLGMLTKGPVALVLVVIPLVAWGWLHADRIRAIGWRPWIHLAGVVLAINGPWYIAICARQPEFAYYFFWQHNLERFVQPFDHVQPAWYYGPILLAGLLPATFWLGSAARALYQGEGCRRSPELAGCLLAGGWCILFFSASGCKLPTYILPAFPMLALALGVLLERGPRLFTRGQWVGGCAWLALVVVAHYVAIPAYAHERSPLRDEEVVRRHCEDPAIPVVCFPRNCDSVAFYLGRDDLRSFRSKYVHLLVDECRARPRTVVLCTHNSSMQGLSHALPRDLCLHRLSNFRREGGGMIRRIAGETPWGLCDIVSVQTAEAKP